MESIVRRRDHESEVHNSREERDEASTSSGYVSHLSEENIQRISDALYKFYEPTEARSANLDIFFFHAFECEGAHIQDAHISSWRSSSEAEEIWPQKWLSQDFPHSRIISISYDCCTERTDERGTMDMYQITENLLQEIVWARKEHDCDRPVIFVGHGFGGVVMKQLCVYAHNKKENLVGGRDVSMFVDSIRGLFFYSTPHRGVEGLKPPSKKEGRLLRWRYLLNEELVRLHEDFCKLEYRYRWIIFGVAGQDSNLGRPGLRLREGSSRYGDNYITVSSSHFSVCRPSNKFSNEYLHLQTLIQDVLNRVELERKQYLTLPKVMVGFDGLIADVLGEHLRIHAFVGVCGMGGVGKTTLAKLIFNKACMKFEFTCFAEEIKGLTGPKSEMKRKVWEQVRHRGVPVRKADQVYADEWYQVKGKSLLVIFDDVDSYQHPELLREIAEDNGCVESLFILTSQNSQLLREVYGDDLHIIRLDRLGNEDARKLLTAYAFPTEQEPPESLQKIVQEVTNGCEGLPLTLEILGKHLRHQPFELWAEIPGALRRCTKDIADLEQRLWARLQLSYDGLPGNEVKNMFLDIASFFVLNNESGWNPFSADDAIMAWSSIYGSVHNRLKTLVDRSLVTVRSYEVDGVTRTEFYMHEHLRRMGQRIAREEGRSLDLPWIRSSAEPTSEDQNLYPYDEEIVFQGCKEELGKIVAHRVMINRRSMAVLEQSCSFCIMHELWPKLSAIQFMDLRIEDTYGCEECRSQRVHLPSNLVLLRLELPCEPALSVEAGGNSGGDLDGTLSLSTCTSLVKLELAGCKHLGELSRLQQLRVLMIRWCQGAGNWTTSLGGIRRLERLELLQIEEPFELPVSFGHLTALQHLKISKCTVRSIPVSFTNLTNLRFLEMDEIVGAQAVSVGSFSQLRVFKIKCRALADLAEVFRWSTALKSLNLELKEAVPDVFGHLENLREFCLTCSGLENNLVESWGTMTNLEYLLLSSMNEISELKVMLDLRSARSLKSSLRGQLAPPGIFEPLPVFLTRVEDAVLVCEDESTTALTRNMINLKHLAVTVHGQQPVQDIFGRLQNLRKFRLECSAVENSLVESLGNMINLEDLVIVVHGQQTVWDIFGSLQKLRKFRLKCNSVENSLVESLGNMISLEDLTIEVQGQQAIRDSFGYLQNLRRFRLVCGGMENNLMGSLAKLTSLQKLDVNSKHENAEVEIKYEWKTLTIRLKGQQAESSILEPLPVFLRKVDELDLKCEYGAQTAVVRNMIHLESVLIVVEGPGAVPDFFWGLQNLRKFTLVCHAVEHNLEVSFGALSSLKLLELRCKTVERFPHVFGCFSTLKQLRISCPSLRALPITVGNFIRLRTFKLFATGMQSLPDSVGQLSQLRELSILDCNHLTTLPESLGQLQRLVSLKVRQCQNLKTLPESVGQLSSLRCLDLKGSALHFLPDSLKNLSQLRRLNISRCSNLDLPLAIQNFPQVEYESDGSSGSDKSYDLDSSSESDED